MASGELVLNDTIFHDYEFSNTAVALPGSGAVELHWIRHVQDSEPVTHVLTIQKGDAVRLGRYLIAQLGGDA